MIRVLVITALAAGCASSKQPPSAQTTPPNAEAPPEPAADPIAAAVAHPDRPAADRDRDADRKPAEVVRFFGVEPGMKVADLMTGFGYYAEIFARVVGPTGTVYAQNNKFVVERFADKPLGERLARLGLDYVVRLDRELEDPGLPEGELDVAVLVLFYHDTYWQKTDRAAMNKAIYAALKPGGVFGVVDHHAAAGSKDRDVQTLHRVDAEMVKAEILAAGFVLDAESDVLRRPEDDRTKNVFDKTIRGKTDRFVYRFRKPQ